VALELASKGYEVVLTPHNISNWEITKLAPDVVLLNYLRKNNETLVHFLLEAKIAYAVLDTEGGVFDDYANFLASLTSHKKILSGCSGYFTWGSKIKSVLEEHKIINDHRIFVTGQPRMDFYFSQFKQSLALLHPQSKNRDNFILINGTFSFSRPRYSNQVKEFEQIKSIFGMDPDYAAKMLAYEKYTYPNLLRLIKDLSLDLPNRHFIYRPHPFEDPSEAIAFFKDNPRIEVNNSGSVDGWLSKCAAVIQLNCSTAFEAAFIKKPVFAPAFVGEVLSDPRIRLVSHVVSNYSELLGYLTSIENYKTPQAQEEAFNLHGASIYFKSDGLAHERCAENLAIIAERAHGADKKVCEKYYLAPEMEDHLLWKVVVKKMLYFLKLHKYFKFGDTCYLENKSIQKWLSSEKAFTHETVEGQLSILKQIKSTWSTVNIIENGSSHSVLLKSVSK
jgi:surface carbohydrate biosynthesis protein